MERNKECPECGCKEIGRGRQMAQGSMYPLNKVFASGSQVVSEICTNCGYILSMRVKNPEKFK